jgi:hypothetical protein
MIADLVAEHQEKLRSSKIDDLTATKAQLRSAAPYEIPKYAGVRSALVFPYPRLDGSINGDYRMRLFPPRIDEEGKEQKYYQPHGSEPPYTCHHCLIGRRLPRIPALPLPYLKEN